MRSYSIPTTFSLILLLGLLSVTNLAGQTATAQADLLIGPTSLEFAVADGAGQPLPQSILVASSGKALNFEAHVSSKWLFVSQVWGATPATLRVTVDTTGLARGVYQDMISLTSDAATNAVVSVTLRVGGQARTNAHPVESAVAPGKPLRASPSGFTFIAKAANAVPDAQSLFVPRSPQEDGVVALSSAAWLTTSPATTASSPNFQELKLIANPHNLAPGQYTATVTLRSRAGGNRSIPVTFDVGDDPHLVAEPSVLKFTAQPGGANPAIQTISILSTSGSLKYTASTESCSWLAVGPQTGATGGLNTISIAVSPAGLPVGTHTCSISVAAPGAMEPLAIPVALTVSSDAGILVNGQSNINVKFSGALGGPPQTMTFQITSSNAGETFTVQPGTTNWLTISPLTGTVPATLTFTADPNAAGLGVQTAEPYVAGSAGGDEVNFFVTFTVAAGNASTISASPTSLSFAYTVGGSAPPSQTVQLTSTTSNTFTAQTDASYVNVTPTSGSTGTSPTTLTVSATPNGLDAGAHVAHLLVSGGLSSGSNILSIPVIVNVTSNAPTCSTSVSKVSFTSIVGATPPSQTVQLTCTAATNFTAATGQSFDSVTPASGTVPAGTSGTALTIAVKPGSFPAGSYSDTVTITPTGAPPLQVTVLYTIASATALIANPSTVSFTQAANGPAPPTQTVALTSGTPTSFTAASDASFLTVSPASGTTPSTLTLTVNAGGMSADVYQGHINVTGTSGTVTITATVTVTSSSTSGAIVPTPASLAFTVVSGRSARVARTITLNSTPAAAFSAASDQSWLLVTPASGTTGANNLTVTVTTKGLAPGNYAGTITITPSATGASGAVSIPVTLTVVRQQPGPRTH